MIYNFEKEIKILRYINLSHYIVIIVSLYLYFIGNEEFYFTSKTLYIFHKYSLIFLILIIINPTLLIIAVPSYKNNKKAINSLKKFTFIFLFISFVIGLLINISIWKTSTGAKLFTKNCPFHFNESLLNSTLEKYLKEKSKNNDKKIRFCNIRNCLLYNEDENTPLGYSYICNYDSFADFKYKNNGTLYKRISSNNNVISSNEYIKCSKIKSISTNNNILLTYINLCEENTFYNCELFDKPKEEDVNSINNKESCPKSSYEKTAFLLGISYLLIDIICFSFLFLIKLFILIKMEYVLQLPPQNNERNKENQDTINSTINKNNQQNSFKKEKTITIIVGEENIKQNNELFIDTLNINSNTNITNITKKDIKKEKIKNLKSMSNLQILNINNISKDEIAICNNRNKKNILQLKINRFNEVNENKDKQILNHEKNRKIEITTIPMHSINIHNYDNDNNINNQLDLKINTIDELKTHELEENNGKND